jgi:hypothetical protein
MIPRRITTCRSRPELVRKQEIKNDRIAELPRQERKCLPAIRDNGNVPAMPLQNGGQNLLDWRIIIDDEYSFEMITHQLNFVIPHCEYFSHLICSRRVASGANA